MSCVNILPKTEVTLTLIGTPFDASGSISGTDTITEISGTSIPLSNSKIYRQLDITINSQVDSCFEVCREDDGNIIVLWEGSTGPGNTTIDTRKDLQFNTGSTGIQRLFVRARNASADELDDLKSTIVILAI